MKIQVVFFDGCSTLTSVVALPKAMCLSQCVDYVYSSREFDRFFEGDFYLKSVTIL